MRHGVVRAGAVAAAVGGAGWVVKGTWILATDYQPPVVFEAGPPLFLLALWGLGSSLEWPGSPGRWAKRLVLGAAIAISAMAFLAVAVPRWLPEGEELTPIGALLFASFLAMLGALLALGLVVRRMRAFSAPWHGLPFAMAVAALPSILLSGLAAEALGNERILEVAIVVLGAAWIILGVCMWRTTR